MLEANDAEQLAQFLNSLSPEIQAKFAANELMLLARAMIYYHQVNKIQLSLIVENIFQLF